MFDLWWIRKSTLEKKTSQFEPEKVILSQNFVIGLNVKKWLKMANFSRLSHFVLIWAKNYWLILAHSILAQKSQKEPKKMAQMSQLFDSNEPMLAHLSQMVYDGPFEPLFILWLLLAIFYYFYYYSKQIQMLNNFIAKYR